MAHHRLLTIAALSLAAAPLAAYGTATTPSVDTPLAHAQQTAARLGTTLSAAEAEPLSSDNVSLVTTIPGTYIGARIVGDLMIATGTDGISRFDISDPAQPVPTGFLPLPHFENEDVDSNGKIALVSNDREKSSMGSVLYVIDVKADPMEPLAVVNLSDLNSAVRGPGHIANCVAKGCKWAWLTGGRKIWVVDLRNPAAPDVVRGFDTPVSTGTSGFGGEGKKFVGATHDVEMDAQGRLWVTGSGGMAVYDGADPVHPQLLSYTGKAGYDPKVNDFILHNSRHPDAASYRPHGGNNLRAGDVMLVTEEDYVDTDAEPAPGSCNGQGRFETWDVRNYSKGRTPTPISQWQTEVSGAPMLSDNKAPLTANCSSHWFSERHGLVADGWYEQGTRILDVRDPAHIRQVGYWLPPNAVTWAAYWVTNDIIYTADVGRGIDVLKISGTNSKGGADLPTVVAPIRASWLGAAPKLDIMRESHRWHWVCADLSEEFLRR
jgi:hypothetical protein